MFSVGLFFVTSQHFYPSQSDLDRNHQYACVRLAAPFLTTFNTVEVLNDLGIIILDANNQGPRAISFGGATPSLSCHISLLANQEILIFPVSFRSWSGAVSFG